MNKGDWMFDKFSGETVLVETMAADGKTVVVPSETCLACC